MGLYKYVRTSALGVLRYFPRTRQMVRKVYWRYRGRWFDKFAAERATDPRLIVFESFMGRSYACSPRALYETMRADARFADYRFVWSFRDDKLEEAPLINELSDATLVVRGTREYYDVMAKAKFWVTNSRSAEYLHPKEDQVYIQCWHGTPLKRLGYDIEIETQNALNTTDELASRYGVEAAKWSYLVSPSPYTSKHLASAFDLSAERAKEVVLEIGYPRNDAIVNACRSERYAEIKEGILDRLGIPKGKKLLLYAPTWRDNDYKVGVGYVQDELIDFDMLRDTLSDEWCILFRPHYFVANSFDFSRYGDFAFNAANVSDINDLYIVADALLTDYSSVFFDYACTGRPLLFYMPDLEHYALDVRGFYLDPVKDLPGPHCETTAEVVEAVQVLDRYFDEYGDEYAAFQRKFCPLEDGKAAQRLADKVWELSKAEKGR